jgi:vitamin K-dependent gamma-carboxylase-like protein
MKLLSRFDWLGERSRPHYGQLVLWTLLACACCLCLYFELYWGEKRTSDVRTAAPTSLLSFLPADLLLSRGLIVACGAAFAAGAALWAARRLVPWSGWLTALSFNAVVALYLENSSQETHVAHVAGGFLLIYALWYTFYGREIREADRQGRFWRTALYPRWVYSLSVFYLGLFYALSGFNKIAVSGLGWANGLSLQLWAELFGFKDSVFTQAILSSRMAAAAMQWAALLGECGGLVAVVSARLRPLMGLLLIGFHVAQICVFGWGFHANMLMLALVFLPAYPWTPRVVAWWERRGRAVDIQETLSRDAQRSACIERSAARRG